jgi:hypothetical protein
MQKQFWQYLDLIGSLSGFEKRAIVGGMKFIGIMIKIRFSKVGTVGVEN